MKVHFEEKENKITLKVILKFKGKMGLVKRLRTQTLLIGLKRIIPKSS